MSVDMGPGNQKEQDSVYIEEPQVGPLAMGEQINFRCKEHKASFERLTVRQQQYIEAYMRSGSPTQVAKDMGLTGSVKGVSKTLGQISRRMGLSTIKDLGVARALDNNGKATAKELKRILEKQKFRCALSGSKLSPETSQLDHIVPLSEGGTNDSINLQWVDERVNRAKGTMSQEDFIKMCNQVSQWSR